MFESPHRLLKLLSELKENLPETRRINISREISKIHEENINGTAEELLLHFDSKKIKVTEFPGGFERVINYQEGIIDLGYGKPLFEVIQGDIPFSGGENFKFHDFQFPVGPKD